MAKLIFVDVNRCMHCRSCELACAREHKGLSLVSVTLVDGSYSIPLSCRQCEKSPCISTCSPKAMARDEMGIITIEPKKCNGCKLCVMVCPFGAIQFDYVTKVVKVCDLCRERLQKDKLPACVATCPAKALMYDELDHVMQRIREEVGRGMVRGTDLRFGFLLRQTFELD